MLTYSVKHSQYRYRDALDRLVGSKTRWLDLGCGHTILPEWMSDSVIIQKEFLSRCELARGCDPVDGRPHVAGLIKQVNRDKQLPFANGYFNLVTANMVVEHLADPMAFMCGVRRVLANNGLLLIHTPNLYYFQAFAARLLPNTIVRSIAHYIDGRESDDIFRTYYRMNTRSSLQRLPGFKVQSLECVENVPQFGRIPLVGIVESILIRQIRLPALRNLRANWIAVLQKIDSDPTTEQKA